MLEFGQDECGFFWLDLCDWGLDEAGIRLAAATQALLEVLPEQFKDNPLYSICVLVDKLMADDEDSIQVECRIPNLLDFRDGCYADYIKATLIYDKRTVGQALVMAQTP